MGDTLFDVPDVQPFPTQQLIKPSRLAPVLDKKKLGRCCGIIPPVFNLLEIGGIALTATCDRDVVQLEGAKGA